MPSFTVPRPWNWDWWIVLADVIDHPQVLALHDGMWIHVDQGMEPLLQALWQRGLETSFSCQGHDFSPAYILFPCEDDAETFESRLWVREIPCKVEELIGGTRVMFAAKDLLKITEVWAA